MEEAAWFIVHACYSNIKVVHSLIGRNCCKCCKFVHNIVIGDHMKSHLKSTR